MQTVSETQERLPASHEGDTVYNTVLTQNSNNCVSGDDINADTVSNSLTQNGNQSTKKLCQPNHSPSNGSSGHDTVNTETQSFSAKTSEPKFSLNADVTIMGDNGVWKVMAVEPSKDGFRYTVVKGKKQFKLAEFQLSAIGV